MKNLSIFALMIVVLTGCSTVLRTSTHTKIDVATPITAVMADLEVSPTKISHYFIPTKTVRKAGTENVVNHAVQEALEANGNADVLVGIEKNIKYNYRGKVESIVITGYPAKYVNFRSPSDDYFLELLKLLPKATSGHKPLFGKFLFSR